MGGRCRRFGRGKTYDLVDVTVRKYGMTKYLSYSVRSSKKLGDDIADVQWKHCAGLCS